MSLEVVNYSRSSKTVKEKCKCYLYYHVILTLDDGSTIDGIIESIDGDNIKVLIGQDMMDENMNRGPRPGGNRYRRYRPVNYPVGRINNIGLIPYPVVPIIPPIYPYPYYPII